jgi:hypothetical protein
VARTESHALGSIADEGAAVDVAADAARILRWALLTAVVLLCGLGVWLASPRFAIDGPSLVDDWSAIANTREQLGDLVRLDNPETERFRPAWIVWNYVQWHTLDAPAGLVGPNVWNLVRTFVLIAGLVLATALALPAPKTRAQALVQAGLAAMPAFMVLTVPKFARELARFSPQEPLLLGAMALGGSLLVLAARSLLGRRPVTTWHVAGLGLIGSVVWILGVYQKEITLAVLPLVAAALYAGRERLARWPTLSTGRRVALGGIGAVVALPLAHVAIVTARIVARGDLVYDAEVDSGQGILRGLEALYDWKYEVFSRNVLLVTLVLLALAVIGTILLRRVDVLALAALVAGGLTLLYAAQTGVAANRYYMPALALAGFALAVSLAKLPLAAQVAALGAILLVSYPSLSLARDEVQAWTDEERLHFEVVRTVDELEEAGCPISAEGLDVEAALALPVLVGMERPAAARECARGATYVVLPAYPDERLALVRACEDLRLVVGGEQYLGVYECTKLGTEPVRHPSLGTLEPEEVLVAYRFRPAGQS